MSGGIYVLLVPRCSMSNPSNISSFVCRKCRGRPTLNLGLLLSSLSLSPSLSSSSVVLVGVGTGGAGAGGVQ